MSEYARIETSPAVDDYCHLRTAAGLSPKTVEAAEIILPNTWFGVQIVSGGETVGMGRIVGNGGCYFQIVDIGVGC